MKKRLIKVLKRDLILGLVFLIYYLVNQKTGFYIPCLFHEITHLNCPGCGVTRMLFSILKLNFKAAFWYNPLVFIYLPFILFWILYDDYIYIFAKENKLSNYIPKYLKIMIIIITLVYGVVRNIVKI